MADGGFDPTAGIASGLGSIVSSAMNNAAAQHLANQAQSFDVAQSQWQTMANQQQNLETQAYNAQQAEIQRQFAAQQQTQAEGFEAAQVQQQQAYETSMSNTAYQRSRADMVAAGLNPMLMAGMGGASTPATSAASMSPASGSAASAGPGAASVGARGRVAPVQSLVTPALISSAVEASLSGNRADAIDAGADASQAAAGKNRQDTAIGTQLEREARARANSAVATSENEIKRQDFLRQFLESREGAGIAQAAIKGSEIERGAPKELAGGVYRLPSIVMDWIMQMQGNRAPGGGPHNAKTLDQQSSQVNTSGGL